MRTVIINYIFGYIKQKFPMYCHNMLDTELMNFSSFIYNNIKVGSNSGGVRYTDEEILRGEAWLALDIEVEKKIKEVGIPNRYNDLLNVFNLDIQSDVDLSDLSEVDLKKIMELRKVDISNIDRNILSKELFERLSKVKKSDRQQQLEAFKKICLEDINFSFGRYSEELIDSAIRSTLIEYDEQLKFNDDISFLKQDFLNKFRLHFRDKFLKVFLYDYLKLAKNILDNNFNYSNNVNYYIFNNLSMRVLKNYRFGVTPKMIVNENLINQIVNGIEKKMKNYLHNVDNNLSDSSLDFIVNKIMVDEGELFKLIIEGKKDERILEFLNKFKREQNPRIVSFKSKNGNDSIELIKKYIKDYIMKNLIRTNYNKVVSLDGCVNYVMSSNKFKFDVDSLINKLCVEYYIKEYLKSKRLDVSDDFVKLIVDRVDVSDYLAIFNGAKDNIIDNLYKNVFLGNLVRTYFKNNNLSYSDFEIEYIYGRILRLDKSSVQQYGGYDKIIGNLYNKVLKTKKYISNYLSGCATMEQIDFIIESLISSGSSLTGILKCKHDNEIKKLFMKVKSMDAPNVKRGQTKKKVPKALVYALVIGLLLPPVNAVKHQVNNVFDNEYNDFVAGTYINSDGDEVLGSLDYSFNDESYLDGIFEYYNKLKDCGSNYWMLVFYEAEKVLDETQMNKLVSEVLAHPECPLEIKNMFMINGEKIPTYNSWKLNSVLKCGKRLSYSFDYLCTENRQYFYAQHPTSVGVFVPFNNIDMNALGTVTDSYNDLMNEMFSEFNKYLVLKNGSFSDVIPDWLEEKLKEQFGLSDVHVDVGTIKGGK